MTQLVNPIQAFYDSFEVKTRDNGSKYVVCNNDEYTSLIQDLHEGRMPSDFIYSAIYSITQSMVEHDLNDLEDSLCEIADSNVETDYYSIAQYVVHNPDVLHMTIESDHESRSLWQLVQSHQYEFNYGIVSQILSYFEDEINEYLEAKEDEE